MHGLKISLVLLAAAVCGCWTHAVGTVPRPEAVTPNSNQNAPTNSTTKWRDQEVTTGWFRKGEIDLRGDFVAGVGKGYTTNDNYLFAYIDGAAPASLHIGISSGGTRYQTYVEDNAPSCIANWPSSGTHTFTFGVKGFTVYFKIDGVVATDSCVTSSINPHGTLQYYEYRLGCCNAGSPAIWIQSGGTGTATFNYFQYQQLFSSDYNMDPRDFGMRAVASVTGSMSASSTTLTLNSPADFRVGDQIIVEIGGEAGRGQRNTVGVGGTVPVLNYANSTAMQADHSQPDQTEAYLQTDGRTWNYNAGATRWYRIGTHSSYCGACTYYATTKIPYPLIAKVTAIDASPATVLTLDTASSVATTNANVYLDALPSFYPLMTEPSFWFQDGRDDGLPVYQNMNFSIPAGTWYLSHRVTVTSGSNGNRSGANIFGQGVNSTIIWHPKGTPNEFIDMGALNSNVSLHDFSDHGNAGDNGYGLSLYLNGNQPQALANANRNWYVGNYGAVVRTGNGNTSNNTEYNVNCYDAFSSCADLSGTNPIVNNVNAVVDVGWRDYVEWQLIITNCTGGMIENSSLVNNKYLVQGFEMFACNGASIVNSGGINAMYSTNSSTSWTIDFQKASTIITANSWFGQGDHGMDDAIINVNNNAFGSGNTGLIKNPRIIQQGYVNSISDPYSRTWNNSLKAIHIQPGQTNVTIQGQYPGSGGCSTTLGGYIKAPNYDPNSAEYGPIVMSDANNTTITGIRVVGSAKPNPNPAVNADWGNISVRKGTTGGTVTNNVADVINARTSTTSGNQTNAAYGGC